MTTTTEAVVDKVLGASANANPNPSDDECWEVPENNFNFNFFGFFIKFYNIQKINKNKTKSFLTNTNGRIELDKIQKLKLQE